MLVSPVAPGRTERNRCYRIKIKRNMKIKIDSEGWEGGGEEEVRVAPALERSEST
jgi:hypothetical protein